MEKEEAVRKLRKAEETLRNAIEVLHKQNNNNNIDGEGILGDNSCKNIGINGNGNGNGSASCCHQDSCIANAIGNLCQSFLLAYGVRVGIGILLRAFKLAKGQSFRSVLDLKLLVSEKDLIVREEACRIGLLFGGFTGSYNAIRCFLRKVRGKENPLNPFLAGSVAGLSILALDDSSRRRTLALYLLTRVAQCAYNSAKSKNKFHLWGSHWRHGDTLLFSLASAQVMYSFIMRPETLPKAYWEFIAKTSPVAVPVLKAVRENCRDSPIDLISLSAYLSRKGVKPVNLEQNAPIVPCSILHPDTKSCLAHNANAISSTFRKTFPLYFSLTFVPGVILHLQKFMESPISRSWKALVAAVRSTSFLSAFVSIFQGVICLQRKMSSKDHKLVYWFAGSLASLSVLLEKKSRRDELALYVLPRAADSLWYILVNRHILPDIKNAEVALFSICMGGIMYYLDHEPETMAPFLRGLIRRFLASRISPIDPLHNSGGSNLYTVGNGNLLTQEDRSIKSSGSTSKKEEAKKEELNLEAFSGL